MILHELKNSREEVFVTISIDEELQAIKDVWTAPFESQENFRKALKLLVKELDKQKLSRWLADLRGMMGSWDFNRTWMVEELMPTAKKYGLKYEAIVIPKEVFSKLSTVETILLLDDYEIRQFDNLEDAGAWLKSTLL